jgi:hypothetical protein
MNRKQDFPPNFGGPLGVSLEAHSLFRVELLTDRDRIGKMGSSRRRESEDHHQRLNSPDAKRPLRGPSIAVFGMRASWSFEPSSLLIERSKRKEWLSKIPRFSRRWQSLRRCAGRLNGDVRRRIAEKGSILFRAGADLSHDLFVGIRTLGRCRASIERTNDLRSGLKRYLAVTRIHFNGPDKASAAPSSGSRVEQSAASMLLIWPSRT